MSESIKKLSKMSTILIVGQSTKHFSYYESSVRELIKRGHNIVFRYDRSFSGNTIHTALQNFLKEHGGQFSWIPKEPKSTVKFKFFIRELRTYCWYLRRTDQAQYYVYRWADLFSAFGIILKSPFVKRQLSRQCVFNFLIYLEKLLPIPRTVSEEISSVDPQLVFVSPGNMRHSREVDYIKAARIKGIPTIVSVLSWDNLTNKGMFHYHPDLFLAWNKHHKQELVELHCVSPSAIAIVGAQLFDKWLSLPAHAEPLNGIKTATAIPYILYLGSSSNIAKDEIGVLQRLASEVRGVGDNVRILFKPHPGHQHRYNSINIEGVEILGGEYGLTETHQDVANMRCLIENSIFVIGINTSGMIDSVILGKETYAYVSAEYSETQKSSAHFKVLSQYGVVCEIETYLGVDKAVSYKEEFPLRRKAFISDFIRPVNLNVSSGEIAAVIVESFLQTRLICDGPIEPKGDMRLFDEGVRDR